MFLEMRIALLQLQLRQLAGKSLSGVENGCPFCKSFTGCQEALVRMGIPRPDFTCEDFQI